jgi:putative hydrolase
MPTARSEENIGACSRLGLEGLAVTDHGPAMPGAPNQLYFANLRSLPRQVNGIHVLRGIETNIVSYSGELDLPDWILKRLDVCIASFHDIVLQPRARKEHTEAWLSVIVNPLVDILGHTGRGDYDFDLDAVIPACRQHNKLIEINRHSLDFEGNHDSCIEIARACKTYGTGIVVSSDAHYSGHVGQVGPALQLLDELDFPPALVFNRTYGQFAQYLKERKPWLKDL